MPTVSFPVYSETYFSPLGPFELLIRSTNQQFDIAASAAGWQSVGHDVVLQKIKPTSDWLAVHMSVETMTAWQFYITKRKSSQEQLTISLQLRSGTNVDGHVTTGQNLIAVEFENGSRQIHLGTEDEDAMAERARENDWLPRRLASVLGSYSLEVTSATATGLETTIPQLEVGEQFYFHYILAENPFRESADYPGESDISTWVAVTQSKNRLERAWQQQLQ
ncbi:hypothetical protein KLP40_12175 [Hymenobacter sp. NST-14]|uniref:hypothetical protein n=1 Tax=Hymenobacter piscis TaxID=2839984 RepID=UPI001C027607|nr:hypothetical protein [Hymenobacter piscis]MBT9393921.1 hypothetical protein [Hymenobacter piscis]